MRWPFKAMVILAFLAILWAMLFRPVKGPPKLEDESPTAAAAVRDPPDIPQKDAPTEAVPPRPLAR